MIASSEPVTLIIGIACFVFATFKLWMALSGDRRTFGLWSGAVLLALGMLNRSSYIYAAVDHLTGVNNLAWFLGRVFLVLAVYAFCGSCLYIYPSQQRLLKWSTYTLLLTLLATAFFFWRDIATAPEFFYPKTIVPANEATLIISVVLLVYAAGMMTIPAIVYYRLYQEERVLASRIRWFIIMATSADAVMLFVSRLIFAVLGYFFDLPDLADDFADKFFGLTQLLALLWLAAFLPNRFYGALVKPILYTQKLRILQNLISLKYACNGCLRVNSPALFIPMTLHRYLTQTDLYLYKHLIAILDYKNSLKSGGPAARPGWLQELLNINDEVDYQEQLKAYSQLGQKIRRQQASGVLPQRNLTRILPA